MSNQDPEDDDYDWKKHDTQDHAANALCAIVEEFCDHYSCQVEIDGNSLDSWCKAHNNWHRDYFDHRCHIHVIHKDK